MNDIAQGMKFTIDVKSGLVEMPQRAVLMKGDKNANRVSMALVDGEKAVSLEGATVTGTYVLAGIKMPLLGDVNENEATIILPDECYLASGRYELRMHVTLGSVRRTFLFITGYVESDGEGGTLDVEGVIPNIDDIVAQYAEMKDVTERTLAAAQRAEALAINASGYAASTGMLGGTKTQVRLRDEEGYAGLDFYGRISGETDLTMRGTIRQNLKEVNSRGFARLEYLNAANSRIGRIYTTEDPPTAAEVGIPIITPQMFGAKGDGTDDTAAFQAAMDYLNSRKGALYIPNGGYTVSDTLTITKAGVRVIGEGAQNTVITTTAANKPVFRVVNENPEVDTVSSVFFEHIHLRAPDASGAVGISFEYAVNSGVHHCLLENFSKSLRVEGTGNSFFDSIGIRTTRSGAIGIEHCNRSVSDEYSKIYIGFEGTAAENGIGFQAIEGNVADFTLKYFDVANGKFGVWVNGSGMEDEGENPAPTDIRLTDVICDGCRQRGIYVQNIWGRGSIVVDGGWQNFLKESDPIAVQFDSCHNAMVRNVVFQLLADVTPVGYGVMAVNSKYVSVIGNTFIHCLNGVRMASTENAIIANNLFNMYKSYNGIAPTAIRCDGSPWATVSGNSIGEFFSTAINSESSSAYNNINNNTVVSGTITVEGTGSVDVNNLKA